MRTARLPAAAVTYEDVLRNPDDVDLNYRFAQTQVALGELRAAASTLERILLLAPDLARVRLLYAIVLYRLATSTRSRCGARRRATRRHSVAASSGTATATQAPTAPQVPFLDRPLQLVQGKKESDCSGVIIAGLRAQLPRSEPQASGEVISSRVASRRRAARSSVPA